MTDYKILCTCDLRSTPHDPLIHREIPESLQKKPPLQECLCECHKPAYLRADISCECIHCTPTDTKECTCVSKDNPHVHCPIHGLTSFQREPVSTTDDWEKEFDKTFCAYVDDGKPVYGESHEVTKQFIRDLLVKEKYFAGKKGFQEGLGWALKKQEPDRIQLREKLNKLPTFKGNWTDKDFVKKSDVEKLLDEQ